MSTSKIISSIEKIALSKVIAAAELKKERDALVVGKHDIDLTIRVTGSITVAADTEKAPTVSIPVKEVLALFIARAGITRESSIKLLQECLTDALKESSKGQGAIEEAAIIDDEFDKAVSELTKALPKTPVKGAVKANLNITTL